MAVENEIRLGQLRQQTKLEFLIRWACLAVAIFFCSFYLPGCSDDYERLRAEADWNAKVARACLPSKTETLVNIRHMGDGYIVRRYAPYGSKQPYLSTDVIARSE